MPIETCNNEKCGKKFNWSEASMPTGSRPEPVAVECPYCNARVCTKRTEGTITTAKLDHLNI